MQTSTNKILKFSYLVFPYIIFSILLSIDKKPWFIFQNSFILVFFSFVCFMATFMIFFLINPSNKPFQQKGLIKLLNSNHKIGIILISFFSFGFMILYPTRNLNLGDGNILLENIVFESNLFGYQLTMDELFSALLHSKLYLFLKNLKDSPRLPYTLTSYISAILFLFTIAWFTIKNNLSLFSILILISSGGILLFHGYIENYTIPTLFIVWILVLGYMGIKNDKNNGIIYLLFITIFASFAVLFHLVTAYLVFSLVFICYTLSPKKKFIHYSIFFTVLAIFIITPFFLYFLFFAETRVDLTQTHIANPPFYPLKRLISSNHFKEILGCLVFACFFPFYSTLYFFLFQKKEFLSFCKEDTNKFILLLVCGFLIHGFTFNPLLGFPRDWDVVSFYWFPIAFFSTILFNKYKSEILNFLPLLVFCIIFYISNAVELNIPNKESEKEKELWLTIAKDYTKTKKETIKEIEPNNKKFYAKIDYFLYKSERILKLNGNKKNQDLIKSILIENHNYRMELNKKIRDMNPDWQKEFLQKLTSYHHRYLKLVEQEG